MAKKVVAPLALLLAAGIVFLAAGAGRMFLMTCYSSGASGCHVTDRYYAWPQELTVALIGFAFVVAGTLALFLHRPRLAGVAALIGVGAFASPAWSLFLEPGLEHLGA